MVVTTNVAEVLLRMETEYSVSVTVTVSYGVFTFPSKHSTVKEFLGVPVAEIVVPEFPTIILWAIVIITTTSISAFISKKGAIPLQAK